MSHRSQQEDRVVLTGRGRDAVTFTTLLALTLAVAVPVFARLKVQGDITFHAQMTPDIATSVGAVSYSLWYPLLFWTTLGSSDTSTLENTSAVLLTLFVVAKVLLVGWYVLRVTSSHRWAVVGGVVSLLAMPLPNPANPRQIYLGQITATVWHNSTWILAVPFGLAAFFLGCRFLRLPTLKHASWLSVALVVSTACKPSFSLALLPVLGIATLVVLRRRGASLALTARLVAITFVPVTVLLILQFVLVFGADPILDVTIGTGLFAVWGSFTHSIPWAVVVSLAGPVAMFVALPSARRRRLPVVLSLCALAVAVVEMSVLTERLPDGALATSGNFFWGAHTAMTVVFVVLVAELAAAIRGGEVSTTRWQTWLAGVLVVGHCLAGAYYVLHAGDGFPITYDPRDPPWLR